MDAALLCRDVAWAMYGGKPQSTALAAIAGVSPLALLAYIALAATSVGLDKRARDAAGRPAEISSEQIMGLILGVVKNIMGRE